MLEPDENFTKIADVIDEKEAAKLFSVPDFVGDAVKAIASRVRGGRTERALY